MKSPNAVTKRKLLKNVATQARVTINKLPTGVRGLNDILGGGIPEFSFNIIAGPPGGGKTTLAHQILFANATAVRRISLDCLSVFLSKRWSSHTGSLISSP